MRAHAFLPLDPKGEPDRSAGWVSILDAEDADLAPEKVFFSATGGEQLRASLRVDVLRAPTAEVRRQTALRVAELEAGEERQLSRREKRTVKEEMARSLRQRAFPRVRITDVVWDLDAARVYVWAQSKATSELFLELFANSFALRLEVEGAPRWARALTDEKTLSRLEPTRELWLGFDGVRPLATLLGEDEDA